MNTTCHIAASLLGADLLRLGDAVEQLAAAGVDALHLDVMDGHFVDDIAFGAAWARALATLGRLPVEAHLMVSQPRRQVARFAAAGCRQLTFHLEAQDAASATAADIVAHDMNAGVSLSPATGVEAVRWLGASVGQVLVMTCEPGRGGQPMMMPMLAKVRALATLRAACGHHYRIAVDGGVSSETAGAAFVAGADDLVVGQALVGAPDMAAALSRLRGAGPRRAVSPL